MEIESPGLKGITLTNARRWCSNYNLTKGQCNANLDKILWATESDNSNRNLEAAIISCAIFEAYRSCYVWQPNLMETVAD